MDTYDFNVKKGRTFKGMTISAEDMDFSEGDYVFRMSMAKGLEPELEFSTSSEGSKLIKKDGGLELFISAKDTENFDGDYEYEIFRKDGDEKDDVLSGVISTVKSV